MRSPMNTASAAGRTSYAHQAGSPWRSSRGFSLLELMLAVGLATLLVAAAVPSYRAYVERTKVNVAIGEINRIQVQIQRFVLRAERLPVNLAEAGLTELRDPWGRPYAYLDLGTALGLSAMRKDRNLVPINSDYDLYSVGKDGRSVPPLGARDSLDDVVRANDGGFVGLAADY
jgi:general secretion pathway protein G